jgi:hypothetical protein
VLRRSAASPESFTSTLGKREKIKPFSACVLSLPSHESTVFKTIVNLNNGTRKQDLLETRKRIVSAENMDEP